MSAAALLATKVPTSESAFFITLVARASASVSPARRHLSDTPTRICRPAHRLLDGRARLTAAEHWSANDDDNDWRLCPRRKQRRRPTLSPFLFRCLSSAELVRATARAHVLVEKRARPHLAPTAHFAAAAAAACAHAHKLRAVRPLAELARRASQVRRQRRPKRACALARAAALARAPAEFKFKLQIGRRRRRQVVSAARRTRALSQVSRTLVRPRLVEIRRRRLRWRRAAGCERRARPASR